MDFSTLETNLTLWVNSLATDRFGETIPLEWGRQPQKIHNGPYILAYLMPMTVKGQPWAEYEYDDLTDELVESMHEALRVPLRLSFRTTDQRLGYSAMYYASRFRNQICNAYSRNFRWGAELSVWDIGSVTVVSSDWSGRMKSQAELDITLGINFRLVNENFTGEYITTVVMEQQSGVTDEYGKQVYTEIGEPVIEEDSQIIIATTYEGPIVTDEHGALIWSEDGEPVI